jgi:hypothetical protein
VAGYVYDTVRLLDCIFNEMSIKLPVVIRAVVSSRKSMLSQESLLLLPSFLLLRYYTSCFSKRSFHPCYCCIGCTVVWVPFFARPCYCWLSAVAGIANEVSAVVVILLLLSLCSCFHPALAVALVLQSLWSCSRPDTAVLLLLLSSCSWCCLLLMLPGS